jgi:hypothetical protein
LKQQCTCLCGGKNHVLSIQTIYLSERNVSNEQWWEVTIEIFETYLKTFQKLLNFKFMYPSFEKKIIFFLLHSHLGMWIQVALHM